MAGGWERDQPQNKNLLPFSYKMFTFRLDPEYRRLKSWSFSPTATVDVIARATGTADPTVDQQLRSTTQFPLLPTIV